MRLTNLEIDCYRSLRHLQVENLTDLVVVAGPNGIGKTSLLDAIGLLKDWIASYANQRSQGPQLVRLGCERARIRAEFQLWPAEIEVVRATGFMVTADDRLPAEINIVDREISVLECHPVLKHVFGKFEPESGIGIMEHFGPNRRMGGEAALRNVSLEGQDELRDGKGADVRSGRNFERIYHALAARRLSDVFDYYETGQKSNSLAEFSELFHRIFPSKRFDVRATRRQIFFDVQTADGTHDINLLSEGEREILMVLTALLDPRLRNSVILYDTPEAHLNSAVVRELFREIRRKTELSNQVILTTHSPEIIEETPLDSLYHLGVYSGATQLTRVARAGHRIAVFQELGASLATQLSSTQIAFVEGKDDREVMKRVFPDLPAQVSLVPSSGVNNIMEIAGRVLDLLSEGTEYSRYCAIRDRDHLTDSQRRELTGKYSSLLILERCEIENYLLVPEVLFEVLQDVGDAALKNPDDVDRALEKLAEHQLEVTIAEWVRCQLEWTRQGLLTKAKGPDALGMLKQTAEAVRRAVNAEFTAERIEALAQERRVYMTENWASVWRSTISGKELLKQFAGRYARGTTPDKFLLLVASAVGRTKPSAQATLREELNRLFVD